MTTRTANYIEVKRCRICGNRDLPVVLDLGEQMLTGVFPKTKGEPLTKGPLRLVKCTGGQDVCGLVQLQHSYDLGEMYGDNYGYRSGLNASMVAHLHGNVRNILQRTPVAADDIVVDIGSNDSTTLQAYPATGVTLVGFDPTGVKFHAYYPPHIRLISDFFSAREFAAQFPERKAKIVTSFSMFYDLEQPMKFMQEIHDVLADDGVWVFEQSYMPSMLEMNAYDTVCHEHLEFYGVRQIKWMTDRVGFRILDIELNDVNGGSFLVTVTKSGGDNTPASVVQTLLDEEVRRGMGTLAPYRKFAENAARSRKELLAFISSAHCEGKTVAALGASTKGNVLLQYCGLTDREICCIGDVNVDKVGSFTPGTWIPIVSEDAALEMKPDYFLVMPWHFRRFFENVERLKGFTLVFPLPVLTVVARTETGT
jgi:hypothetical protein